MTGGRSGMYLTPYFFCRFICISRKKAVSLQRNLDKCNMTKKRKQENLAYLLEIEQDMIKQGKRLSKAFYAAKKYAQSALQSQPA